MKRGIAGFAIACGVVLLLASDSSEPAESEQAPAATEQRADRDLSDAALEGMGQAQRAAQSLQRENYGEAREYLAQTQETFARILATLDERTFATNEEKN